MRSIKRLIKWRVSSDAFDQRLAERVMYAGSLLMLVCGFLVLSGFQPAGGEYFLGVLGVLTISLLLMLMGNVVSLVARLDAVEQKDS
jgi:hypothetical protein